jgi:hypothetical protein
MAYAYPSIPEIAKAFENDPRTQLANHMIQAGTSTAPVAGGGWAWADGLARALQGVTGAFVQRKELKEYNKRQQGLTDLMASTLGQDQAAAVPGGSVQPPQSQADMAGGAGQPSPVQPASAQSVPAVDPLAALPEGQGGFDPKAALRIAQALGGPQTAPQSNPLAVPPPQVPPLPTQAQFNAPNGLANVGGMLPITAAIESGNRDFTPNGKPVTSPKGAKYAMQVMPGTAKDPGFGIKPVQAETPQEYDRVGREYLGKLVEKYGGDHAKAWAAYNAGPGAVDKAIATNGPRWLMGLPQETQNYVAKATGAAPQGGGDTPVGPVDSTVGMQATPPTQYSTPKPVLPDMPGRPADRASARSLSLDAGRKLLASGNPDAYATAMAMVEKGLGEQFNSDRETLQSQRDLDKSAYDQGLQNYYGAQSDDRQSDYASRGREQVEGYNYGREIRGYKHEDATNNANHAFTASEGAKDRAERHWETQYEADSRAQTAQDKLQQRTSMFLQTPQGARLYSDANNRIMQNDDIGNNIRTFIDLNSKTDTGGMLMNAPGGAWMGTAGNPNLRSMDAITNKIAPLMRQAGQGSMSDRDLQKFENSVPNIKATRETNAKTADRLLKGIARMNDFETQKVQAAAEGRQVEFMHEWNTYKQQVPYEKGISFDDWKASIPSYSATGTRK